MLSSREVKKRADFFAIASRYTRLRPTGSQWRGLCPFHHESTASFYVEPKQNVWKCFGCERGGDVFDFVMLAEHCDFSSALQIVSDFASRVARESEPRSGERFGAREGAEGPSARGAGVQHSPQSRDLILSKLAATEARNAAIARANAESFAEFERACESPDGGQSLFTCQRADNWP